MDTTTTDVTASQDALRPLRTFVGALTGALQGADQANAMADGYAWNTPGRYQSVGPYGVAMEGTPVATTTTNGGLYVSPAMVMLMIGAAAVLLWKH